MPSSNKVMTGKCQKHLVKGSTQLTMQLTQLRCHACLGEQARIAHITSHCNVLTKFPIISAVKICALQKFRDRELSLDVAVAQRKGQIPQVVSVHSMDLLRVDRGSELVLAVGESNLHP